MVIIQVIGLIGAIPVDTDWKEEEDSTELTSEEVKEFHDVIVAFLNKNAKLAASSSKKEATDRIGISQYEQYETEMVQLQSSEKKNLLGANETVLLISMLTENLQMQSRLLQIRKRIMLFHYFFIGIVTFGIILVSCVAMSLCLLKYLK